MRAIFIISIIASAVGFTAGWHVINQPGSQSALKTSLIALSQDDPQRSVVQSTALALALNLDRYDDPEHGFSVAVPAGWTRIVLADPALSVDPADMPIWQEPGYAVGFESPRDSLRDRFADYILIEVLPGDDSGLFDSAVEHRRYLHTGDGQLEYDKLTIDSELDSSIDVDLVIFQRGVQAFGYTLGFYAIGEPANERALFDAFQVMLRTFIQNDDPFVII